MRKLKRRWTRSTRRRVPAFPAGHRKKEPILVGDYMTNKEIDGINGSTGKFTLAFRFAGQEARQNDAPPSSVSGLRPLGPYLLLRLDQISRANSLLASGSIALISATALETAMFPPSPSNNSRSSIRIYQHTIDTTAIHGPTRTGERAFGRR
jgi:hypothetical protein